MRTNPPARILSHYRHAAPEQVLAGVTWYPRAYHAGARIASKHGYTPEQACGVIASLSPLAPWDKNVEIAETAMVYHALGLGVQPLTLAWTNSVKAWAILDGARPKDVLRGPKVTAFFAAIMGYEDAVTVDTWAWRAAYGCNPPYAPTPAQSGRTGDYYRQAARMVDLSPSALQAIVWIVIRSNS